MSRIRTVAGSSIFGNIVGALTLTATVALGVLGLRSDQRQTAVSGVTSMGISSAHSYLFWGLLVFAAAVGVGLLLPSWIALFESLRFSPAIPPQALPQQPSNSPINVAAVFVSGSDTVIPPLKVSTTEEWTNYKLESFVNQKYEYGSLSLDGRVFTKCTFTHMNLFYDGTAPTAFVECQFDEDTKHHVHTRNPSIAQWMENIRAFGLLKENARFAITPKE